MDCKLLTNSILLAASLVLAACSGFGAQQQASKAERQERKAAGDYLDSGKWGKAVAREYDLSGFNAIHTEGHIEIVFMQGPTYSVKVFGNEKAIDHYTLDVGQTDRRLSIRQHDYDLATDRYKAGNVPGITVVITAPELEHVDLNGGGDLEIKTDISLESDLSIVLNGDGDFEAKDIEVYDLNIVINGRGDVLFKKAVCQGDASILLNNEGDMDAKLHCGDARIEVNGEGDVELKVKCNELTAICNGQGDIELRGECKVLNKRDGAAAAIDSRELQAKKINRI